MGRPTNKKQNHNNNKSIIMTKSKHRTKGTATRLKSKREDVINDRPNNTIGTPLTVKVTTPSLRLKTSEEEGEMKFNPGFNFLNDNQSTRAYVAEAIIIPGMPNKKLANVQNVNKNTRNTAKLIRIKIKQNMTTYDGRALRGKGKQQRLKPR